jgi:hypothetical protein
MSDQTPRNMAELERLLNTYTSQASEEPTKMEIDNNQGMNDLLSKYGIRDSGNTADVSGKDHQVSTGQLLRRMGEYQNDTNRKIDMLTDLFARNLSVQTKLLEETMKSNDLTAMLVRNSMQGTGAVQVEQAAPSTALAKRSLGSCKDYGLNNNTQVIAEFIRVIVNQVIASITEPEHRYPSSQPFDAAGVEKLVKPLTKFDIREGDHIVPKTIPPKTSDRDCVYLASIIGKKDGRSPMISTDLIRQLFSDNECRATASATASILKGMKKLRILLPHYESDIINALGDQPYFDHNGKVLINKSMLVKRGETKLESRAMRCKATEKASIAMEILNGSTPEEAIVTVLG